ncbi:uncharacterized protein LOC141579767 isoform X3 [Camelus bactrianus]|uniref:Uncharacterized protein LOC141579767 isoform X3 n=1 Tax=Camelus bactrianus TaxID=9837 RepID=A0AC58RIN7_CAMBA
MEPRWGWESAVCTAGGLMLLWTSLCLNSCSTLGVHSMVHPRLELSGSKSISEGTYLKRNGFPDSEGQRKHQPGLEKENSISEPVLGDLTEITLVAQASDLEHVPSCSQPQTSTDASYTGKDHDLGGPWPPEIRQMLDSSNAESPERRFRLNSFVADFGRPLLPKVFSGRAMTNLGPSFTATSMKWTA